MSFSSFSVFPPLVGSLQHPMPSAQFSPLSPSSSFSSSSSFSFSSFSSSSSSSSSSRLTSFPFIKRLPAKRSSSRLLLLSIAIAVCTIKLAQASSLPSSASADTQLLQEQQLPGQFVPALVRSSVDTFDLPSDSLHPFPVQKRVDVLPSPGPLISSSATPTTTASKSKAAKPTATQTSMATTTTAAAVKPTITPDSKGDMALFGVPSVVGAYNLTTGILIYSAFMILFLGAVGFATWQRAQYRNQFRLQQRLQMENGKTTSGAGGSKRGGGDDDLSDAALFKQASISKRALMKDVGPGGVMAANDALKTKIASANGAGRSYDEREMANGLGQQSSGLGVRFGESAGATQGTGRTGGMKKTQTYEMNSYGQTDEALSYYQDNHDTTDYSRPPLTESADPYYSSGSSHSGYLDQVEDYHYNPAGGNSPQMPKPSYQQSSTSNVSSPQPGQSPLFVQRTNSSRMPKGELHDGNNIFRSNSGRRVGGGASTPTRGLERNGSGGQPSRIATQGHLDRSGSGGNGYAGPTSPMSPHADGHAMSRSGSNASSGRTKVSGSPTQMHPTPIARSNSARLPPSMRGGGASQPSNLSQANNYM